MYKQLKITLKVRKLAAGTTWANVASEFIIKAVVLKVESFAGCGKVKFFYSLKSLILDSHTRSYYKSISLAKCCYSAKLA